VAYTLLQHWVDEDVWRASRVSARLERLRCQFHSGFGRFAPLPPPHPCWNDGTIGGTRNDLSTGMGGGESGKHSLSVACWCCLSVDEGQPELGAGGSNPLTPTNCLARSARHTHHDLSCAACGRAMLFQHDSRPDPPPVGESKQHPKS